MNVPVIGSAASLSISRTAWLIGTPAPFRVTAKVAPVKFTVPTTASLSDAPPSVPEMTGANVEPVRVTFPLVVRVIGVVAVVSPGATVAPVVVVMAPTTPLPPSVPPVTDTALLP